MNVTCQQRAVVEALGMTPNDLRELAQTLEANKETLLVRDLAQQLIDALPERHLYILALQRLIRWAGDQEADTVTARDIIQWSRMAGDEARRNPNARHGVGAEEAFVLALRAAYARAIEAGRLGHSPAAQVQLPDRPASPRTALESWQLRQAHAALVAQSRDPQLDDLVFQFLRETAARRGGVLALGASDVVDASRAIRLTEKYGKQRWVPASAHLRARLTSHRRARHSQCDVVFHRRDGSHLTEKWFEGFAGRIQRLEWARQLGVSAHWLRHTTLTDIERLAGTRVAGTYAGHADTTWGVTGRYTRASHDELRSAHQRLFFDRGEDAEHSAVPPHLTRRVIPAGLNPVTFKEG